MAAKPRFFLGAAASSTERTVALDYGRAQGYTSVMSNDVSTDTAHQPIATTKLPIKVSFLAPEGGLHHMEADEIKELVEFLDEKVDKGGQLFVRLPDDAALVELGTYTAKSQQKAQGAARMLSGSQAPYWHQAQLFVDNGGYAWRMVLIGMTAHSQAQAAPGPRGVNGRLGRG